MKKWQLRAEINRLTGELERAEKGWAMESAELQREICRLKAVCAEWQADGSKTQVRIEALAKQEVFLRERLRSYERAASDLVDAREILNKRMQDLKDLEVPF